MNRKTKILEKITKAGFPEKEVVISVEEFFEENEDDGSIGANLYPEQPSLQTFYNVFKAMLLSDKVERIYVRIADTEDSDWFYTDTVYVVCDATIEEVSKMFEELKPSEIYTGWMYGLPANLSSEKIDKQVYSVWWD